MQSGRHPKKRPRAERHERHEKPAAEQTPASSVDTGELFTRLGLRWTGTAAILAAVLFFWTWLFLDQVDGRGVILLSLSRPEDFIAVWFGNLGQGQPPLGFFDRWPMVLAAGFILVASVGPGSLLVTLLTRKETSDRLEHFVLAIGAGLNLASLYVLAGGMSMPGALHQPWWIWLGLLVGLLLFPVALWRLMTPVDAVAEVSAEQALAANAEKESKFGIERWGLLVVAGLSLPYLFGGLLPPWDFDVREYHLQTPKEWMQRGQIEFLPHNVYANMPLGAEIHAITATSILGAGDEAWWLGGLTAKLLISLFAPLTALLLWCIGRRTGNVSVGLIAAVCYLTLPWVAHVSLNGLNDAVLGYYLLACWWVWWRSESGDWRALVLAGFFGGAAAAVKYPALIFVVLPLVVETMLRKLGLRGSGRVQWVGPQQIRHAAIALLLLFIGGIAGGSLWYLKNARQTGNPLYPLLVSRFGGETRTIEKDARWVKAHAVPQDENGRFFTVAQLLSKVRELSIRGEFASPLLLPLGLLGSAYLVKQCWRRPRRIHAPLLFPLLALALSGFIFIAWFLITHRLERFLVPALPLVALLAGFGYLFTKELAGSTVARAFFAVGLIYSLLMVAGFGAKADARWFVALNHLRTDPLQSENPNQPTIQRLSHSERWLTQNLKADEAVLLVGGAQVWDLPGKTQGVNVYYNTCFDDCVLFNWRKEKKTVEEFREEFASRNVKYVVVDWAELRRYLSPGNYGYDRRFSAKDSLRQFNNLENTRLLKQVTRIGREEEFLGEAKRPQQVIYRVLTKEEAAADAAAAERARQKAATKNIKPTPKAAPPKSANQSSTSE